MGKDYSLQSTSSLPSPQSSCPLQTAAWCTHVRLSTQWNAEELTHVSLPAHSIQQLAFHGKYGHISHRFQAVSVSTNRQTYRHFDEGEDRASQCVTQYLTKTRSSAVAKRPRDASCLSVVSFVASIVQYLERSFFYY